jgi:DNA polymerase I-like protein with 3'-5' exonuclease and polymerase domains
MRLLFDTESDGLLEDATKVHCLAAINLDTGERSSYGPNGLGPALQLLRRASELVGHNILRHDLPLLRRLLGFTTDARITDTLVLSRLIYPDLKRDDQGREGFPDSLIGRHSIEAWGHRLGEKKGDYAKLRRDQGFSEEEIWGSWSQEMHDYMCQDCETNLKLYEHLDTFGYSAAAIELEHRIAAVCDRMEHTGVPFDTGGAGKLHCQLVARRGDIERSLVERFGTWQVVDRKFVPKRDNKRLGYTAGVEVTKYKTVEFNPGSREHIARVLQDRGWKPTEFTKTGRPEINEDTVATIVAQYPEMSGLGEYLMLTKRLGQLAVGDRALMQAVQPDGKIHGSISTMGTVTGRASHHHPNLGQVPNLGSPFGKEFRSLFYAPEGWVLVGADMAGLELRGLAHYLHPLDGGAYTRTVLEGDPHWAHTIAMGLVAPGTERLGGSELHTILRNGSKTFVYGYVYGAGSWKLGEIIYQICLAAKHLDPDLLKRFFKNGATPEAFQAVGSRVKQRFARGITGFQELKKKVATQYSRHGWMPGLDGRRIPCRSEHSALNAMIQSCGAVLCKRWVCDVADRLPGSSYLGLWVHDEMQIWCPQPWATHVKELCEHHAQRAGEDYGFRVRLDSKATIGPNWSSTH